MRAIEIPFMESFAERLQTGGKTATTRTKCYGVPGVRFLAFGQEYEILAVTWIPLRQVALDFYLMEGFQTPAEFRECWTKLHPRKGWTPEEEVCLHIFRSVDP